MDIDKLVLEYPMINDMRECREIMWLNESSGEEMPVPFGLNDIEDAEARLARFAPYIRKAFPETERFLQKKTEHVLQKRKDAPAA